MILVAAFVTSFQVTPPSQNTWRLPDVSPRAIQVSPRIAAATGAVRAPAGRRAESFWPFPENPTLEYGRVRRRGAATTFDREWALSQEVEVAGQWAVRRSAASAEVRSAEARILDARRIVALEARRAWITLAIAEKRAALTDTSAQFAERISQLAKRLFDAGEANRLELNAAVLEAARARSSAERARAQSDAAATDLARVLALPAGSSPQAAAPPPLPTGVLPPDSMLQHLAAARRPDLLAAQEFRIGAARSLTAARMGLIPNLTVAAIGGREAATDAMFGFSVGVRIPLFHRQQAGVGAAEADRSAAEAEQTATSRMVVSEVSTALAQFSRARLAERRFANEVLRSANENVMLTERALTEGEVDLTSVLVLRTTAVSAQLEYLEVLQGAYDAWMDLAAALALEPEEIPFTGGDR